MCELERFLQHRSLEDVENLDALLDVAELTRQFIGVQNYEGIKKLIIYTVDHAFLEAFSWIMAILQEEFRKTEGAVLDDFVCNLGKTIPEYNELVSRLQMDFNAIDNDVQPITDESGEVLSFFNIFTYRTMYENIFFISSENFDTKDNDFIQYQLLFKRK